MNFVWPFKNNIFYSLTFLFLFSLVNPLDVGVVNLTLRGFRSDEFEDMGLRSHWWRCWSTVCSQLKSLLNLLFTAQVFAEFVIHSSGVYCWSDCPQLRVYAWVILLTAQLTKVDVIYHVMEYFPKSLVYWKGESSALAILLKAEGEPLPRTIIYKFFYQRTPARAVQSKVEKELLLINIVAFSLLWMSFLL